MDKENLLDYIILDRYGRIISMNFDGCEKYSYDGIPSFSLKLMNSMKRGDRTILQKFCIEEYNPNAPAFELFRLVKFNRYSYIFLEKDLYNSENITICFFGKSVLDFIPLMSPNTQLYQTLTGKSIYEIMIALSQSKSTINSVDYLTPEAFILMGVAPELINELRKNNENTKNCDILLLTEKIIDNILNSLFCVGISIELTENPGETYLSKNKIFPVLTAAYTHIFVSVIHILSFMSTDHKILVDLNYYTDGVVLKFSCKCAQRLISDSGSFSDIGRLHNELYYTTKIVNTLAEGLGYNPNLRYEPNSDELSITLKLSDMHKRDTEFKFSDPYSAIAKITAEAFVLLNYIKNAGRI